MQAPFFTLLLAQTVHAQGTSPAAVVVGLAVGIFIVVWLILCCRGGGGDGPASHPAARARAAAAVPAPAPAPAPAVPAPPSRPLRPALQVEDDEPLPVYVPRTISPPPPALSPSLPLRRASALTGGHTSSIVNAVPVDGSTSTSLVATRSPPPQYARVEHRSSSSGV